MRHFILVLLLLTSGQERKPEPIPWSPDAGISVHPDDIGIQRTSGKVLSPNDGARNPPDCVREDRDDLLLLDFENMQNLSQCERALRYAVEKTRSAWNRRASKMKPDGCVIRSGKMSIEWADLNCGSEYGMVGPNTEPKCLRMMADRIEAREKERETQKDAEDAARKALTAADYVCGVKP